MPDKPGSQPKQQQEKAEAYENGIESRIPFINRMYSIMTSARTGILRRGL
jgi:hypothetical protein